MHSNILINIHDNIINLPSCSYRIVIDQSIQYLKYDNLSQDLIRKQVNQILTFYIDRMIHAITKYHLHRSFRKWLKSMWILNTKVGPKDKPLEFLLLTKEMLYKMGFNILSCCVFHRQRATIKSYLKIWKKYTDLIFYMKGKYFDKWNIKISLWKLNRLTGIRFIRLIGPLIKKYRKDLMNIAWSKWIYYVLRYNELRMVRLLFRCWKTFSFSHKYHNKVMMRNTIRFLHKNALDRMARREKLYQILSKSINQKQLFHCLQIWWNGYMRFVRMRRFFSSHSNKIFRKAWNTWILFNNYMNVNRTNIMPTQTNHDPIMEVRSKEVAAVSYAKSHRMEKKRLVAYQMNDTKLVYKEYIKVKRLTADQRKQQKDFIEEKSQPYHKYRNSLSASMRKSLSHPMVSNDLLAFRHIHLMKESTISTLNKLHDPSELNSSMKLPHYATELHERKGLHSDYESDQERLLQLSHDLYLLRKKKKKDRVIVETSADLQNESEKVTEALNGLPSEIDLHDENHQESLVHSTFINPAIDVEMQLDSANDSLVNAKPNIISKQSIKKMSKKDKLMQRLSLLKNFDAEFNHRHVKILD